MKHRIKDMICENSQTYITTDKGGIWVRSVPEPFHGGLFDRLRDAWSVLKGETYSVIWPKPGELESALDHPIDMSKEEIQKTARESYDKVMKQRKIKR